MKEFKHPNMENFKCPICHTGKDAPVVLVGIPGTEDGNIMRAEQVHSKCYEELNQIIESTVDEHPYKESGNIDSYSEYNEGWTDACYILGENIIKWLQQMITKKQ